MREEWLEHRSEVGGGSFVAVRAAAMTSPRLALAGVLLVSATLAFMFADGMSELLRIWSRKEEYSHGFLIPIVSALMIWARRAQIRVHAGNGSWLGLVVVAIGVSMFVVGELSTLYIVVHYSMVVVLGGLCLSYFGFRGTRPMWPALVLLLFAIPLPLFLYNQLSAALQLISSELGVLFIRMVGIPVFLEGNIIDLGTFKLQVVEACDGLRYLFPLASFGFICACMYSAPLWQRALLIVSTIPITVVMNSARIALTGMLVDYRGVPAAEGFLHFFEGWAIFMTCVALLFAEILILVRLRRDRPRFADVFGLDIPRQTPVTTAPAGGSAAAFWVAVPLLLLATVGAQLGDDRREEIPLRDDFVDFPSQLGGWLGFRGNLDGVYLDALQLSDYLLADYQDANGEWVNLYVAYYDSQRTGKAAHSPRACIPAGGWEIRGLTTELVPRGAVGEDLLTVNRVEIQRGEYRQLVYYWFRQRGRLISSEYLVKAYMLWDSIRRGRSDGALVRLTTMLEPGETWEAGDARLGAFVQALGNTLSPYVPD
jgi:exosortase D (VPLPA-CTERM-specific)